MGAAEHSIKGVNGEQSIKGVHIIYTLVVHLYTTIVYCGAPIAVHVCIQNTIQDKRTSSRVCIGI